MSMMSSYKKVKPAHVVVTMANGQVIDGTINIGFEGRVSDFLAISDRPFIAVFDVKDGKDVLILNKSQISSVQPQSESSSTGRDADSPDAQAT